MMLIAVVIFLVGSARLRAGADDADADRGARAAGHRRRRHPAAGADHHRRHGLTPRERARYQSYSSVMFMAASILGPVLGGVLTDYVHWS